MNIWPSVTARSREHHLDVQTTTGGRAKSEAQERDARTEHVRYRDATLGVIMQFHCQISSAFGLDSAFPNSEQSIRTRLQRRFGKSNMLPGNSLL